MLPRFLLDADDDWQEGFRGYWFPRIHHILEGFGDLIGVPLYAVGTTGFDQYVAKLDEVEEAIEEEFVDMGFRRNPVACFKSLPDGRDSEGSWVLLHEDAPDFVAPGMQLHVTMYERKDRQPGRELYAHYEDDWRVAPLAHLRGKNLSVTAGVEIAHDYFDQKSFLVLN